jgi:dipeptidyl aminopeptidase/acylaminoacyl peptidase
MIRSIALVAGVAAVAVAEVWSQEPTRPPQPLSQQTAARAFEATNKAIDDVYWHFKVGDLAVIDKVVIAASKPIRMTNPTGQGAGNPLLIFGYTFIPKSIGAKKAPLIVYVHGGVHGDFDTGAAHIVRELLEQGYIVAAPDYRGSTGYGGGYYDQVDYGGAEIDDTHDVRNWAVENIPQVDPSRVGIIGWSHGGYHTLFNIFRWPDDYKVAYAGVPVSDLVQRMGYKSQEYRDIFASFIGKQAEDDPAEYRKRSPVNHVEKLRTPLLVHTNTNDEDVNVMEVQHLIEALKAAGKTFEHKIYENAPGGHSFNVIDTKLAKESRREIWAFLGRYLKP